MIVPPLFMDRASVFVSWSGHASKGMAQALRTWLPQMFQTVEPLFSSDDISAGSVWFETVGRHLRRSTFAIVCVTPENLDSSWLHFEAGAIGMAQGADETTPRNVVPYLLDMTPASLEPPFHSSRP